jgi:hypothetical protein
MEAQAIARIPHWQDNFTDQRPIYPYIQSVFVVLPFFAE